MKVETLRKIAREYRAVAERKLDDKDLCKGFSDLCRDEGIAWTQLRALVDAETADSRDGGKRVEKIVEKADYASSYADILSGHDEPIVPIRSSSVSIAAGTASPAHKPAVQEPLQEQPKQAVQSTPSETPDLSLPRFLDRSLQ